MIEHMVAKDTTIDEIRFDRPCDSWLYVQPKLNGIRALWDPHAKSLFTRGGSRITSVPHVEKAIVEQGYEDLPLDGEIYLHGLEFDSINALCRQHQPTSQSLSLEYHCFDIRFFDQTASERQSILSNLHFSGPLKGVLTKVASTRQQIASYYQAFLESGYEGIILRHPDELYTPRSRGPWLMRIKPVFEDEAKLIAIGAGGRSIQLRLSNGKTFGCMVHKRKHREMLSGRRPIGANVTFQYRGLSSHSIPISPRFKSIRWDTAGQEVKNAA